MVATAHRFWLRASPEYAPVMQHATHNTRICTHTCTHPSMHTPTHTYPHAYPNTAYTDTHQTQCNCIRAGVYRDSLLIDKAVHIRGVGRVLVEVEGGTAVTVSAPTGALENVCVRQLRGPACGAEGGGAGKFVGIDIRAGMPPRGAYLFVVSIWCFGTIFFFAF